MKVFWTQEPEFSHLHVYIFMAILPVIYTLPTANYIQHVHLPTGSCSNPSLAGAFSLV